MKLKLSDSPGIAGGFIGFTNQNIPSTKRGDVFLLGRKKGGSCLPPEIMFLMCKVYQRSQKEYGTGALGMVPGFMAFRNALRAVCRSRYASLTVF